MTRFMIVYRDRKFHPWKLHEHISPKEFWRRSYWREIKSAPTKEELEQHIREIVEGEKKVQATFYDHTGQPETAW